MNHLKPPHRWDFDTKKAYIFLLSLAVICALLGIVVTTSEEFLMPTEDSADTDTAHIYESDLPPEVIMYTMGVAKESLHRLMGNGIGDASPTLDQGGERYIYEADNLRVTFSAHDGSLESFVHIRLGDTPEKALSREECLLSAVDFLNRALRGKQATDAVVTDELCGFVRVDIAAGDERYNVCVDGFGRVLSIFKVKRS